MRTYKKIKQYKTKSEKYKKKQTKWFTNTNHNIRW